MTEKGFDLDLKGKLNVFLGHSNPVIAGPTAFDCSSVLLLVGESSKLIQ